MCAKLGFEHPKMSGYSLRRGGASWHFHAYNSYDLTTEAGRWSQIRTARIYIDQAAADAARTLHSKEDERLQLKSAALARAFVKSIKFK